MPTLPPPPERRGGLDLHPHRQMAESFGSDARRYDRSRPRYPEAMVTRIVAASPGLDVVDVGCGTGIVARQFQAAGCRVLGVDVDTRMVDLARQRGLDAEVAAFEAWDPAGRVFDAVVSGQAWHWLDPAAGAAKAAQVLRPEGRLAVFWNVFRPPADVREAFAALYRRIRPDVAPNPWAMPALDAYVRISTRAAEAMREVGGFGAAETWRFDWDRSYTRDQWLDQLPTHGDNSQLPPGQREQLLTDVGAAIDEMGGSFTMGYAVIVVTAARTYAP